MLFAIPQKIIINQRKTVWGATTIFKILKQPRHMSSTGTGSMESSTAMNPNVLHKHYFPGEYGNNNKLACIMIYPHNHYTFRISPVRKQFMNVVNAICIYGQEDVIVLCNTQYDYVTFQNEYNELRTIEHQREQQQKQSNNIRIGDTNDTAQVGNDNNSVNKVIPLLCPSSDSWARDSLPTFVLPVRDQDKDILQDGTNTAIIGLNWIFNGWGNKIPKHEMLNDIQMKEKLIPILNDYYSSLNNTNNNHVKFVLSEPLLPIVLEGGSIHTNGTGIIITTEECLLNNNRNPTFTKEQIEQCILYTTGCKQMIWLPTGVANDDDTNGHIDNFACFISSTIVLLAWTDLLDVDYENYHRCRKALSILENLTDGNGNKFIIHKIHLPRPIYYTEEILNDIMLQQQGIVDDNNNNKVSDDDDDDTAFDSKLLIYNRQIGQQMAGSYVNFYISNHAVIVPQFYDSVYDAKAIETLIPVFPNHQIIGVYTNEILIGGGNIHCMTQQIPLPYSRNQK